jgi:hypothetical protein
MVVEMEPCGVGPEENKFIHPSGAFSLEGGVNTGKTGVVGASFGSHNIKQ